MSVGQTSKRSLSPVPQFANGHTLNSDSGTDCRPDQSINLALKKRREREGGTHAASAVVVELREARRGRVRIRVVPCVLLAAPFKSVPM